MRTLCLVTGLALLAGCGASPTHVDGTFRRAPIDGHDAAFITFESRQADGTTLSQLFLQIGDKSCGVQSPSNRLVQLGLFATAHFDAGTYAVRRGADAAADPQVWGTVGELDSACTLNTDEVVAGSVTLREGSERVMRGGFDVTLSSGDHLSGAFDATRCEQLLQPMACK